MRQLSNYFIIAFFFAIALMIVGCGGSGEKNDSVNIPPINIPPIFSPSGDSGNENSNFIIWNTPQDSNSIISDTPHIWNTPQDSNFIISDTPQVSIDREKTECVLFENHFPTFLSHLLGGVFTLPDGSTIDLPFAKVTVKNDSNVSVYDLRLEVSISEYSQSAAEVFDIGPYQTKEFELTPNFITQDLFNLNEEEICNIHLKLSDFQGKITDELDKSISLLSKNDWVRSIEGKDLTIFVPVFVTPRNELVKEAVAAAKEYMFNKSLVGYQNMSRSFEIKDLLGKGKGYDKFFALQGENISIRIDSIETISPYSTLDYLYVVNDLYFTNQTTGRVSDYMQDAKAEDVLTFTAPSDGWYSIVFDSSNSTITRTVYYTRDLSHYEITYCQLESIYNYLQGQGINYVNIPVSFFENSQSIKYPNEVLTTKSGNCIDLTCLFASMVEALGMRPILIIIPGHAFVGVSIWSDSGSFHALETTMVGSDSFSNAWDEGSRKMTEKFDSSTGKEIDVKMCRDAGILPAPIN